jgi:hypothetical protein
LAGFSVWSFGSAENFEVFGFGNAAAFVGVDPIKMGAEALRQFLAIEVAIVVQIHLLKQLGGFSLGTWLLGVAGESSGAEE